MGHVRLARCLGLRCWGLLLHDLVIVAVIDDLSATYISYQIAAAEYQDGRRPYASSSRRMDPRISIQNQQTVYAPFQLHNKEEKAS
jgi:hypothetical protein